MNFNLLTDPWVTGIGGGIISGLIVFFITKLFFEKNENKEYLQNVDAANRELLHSLRSLISKQTIVSEDIAQSMIHAASRKFNVKPDDMLSFEQLLDDLILEIMQNSFLTPESKVELSEKLSLLKKAGPEVENLSALHILDKNNYTDKLTSTMALTTGLMAALTTLAFTIAETKGVIGKIHLDQTDPKYFFVVVPAALAMLSGLFAGYVNEFSSIHLQISNKFTNAIIDILTGKKRK